MKIVSYIKLWQVHNMENVRILVDSKVWNMKNCIIKWEIFYEHVMRLRVVYFPELNCESSKLLITQRIKVEKQIKLQLEIYEEK